VADVLDVARARYGDRFADVLAGSRVWLNGEPADPSTPVTDRDEVAVLPPVSGGAAATTTDTAVSVTSGAYSDPYSPKARSGTTTETAVSVTSGAYSDPYSPKVRSGAGVA
jgi:molybdopterin synthase sulfur carrier subunit